MTDSIDITERRRGERLQVLHEALLDISGLCYWGVAPKMSDEDVEQTYAKIRAVLAKAELDIQRSR